MAGNGLSVSKPLQTKELPASRRAFANRLVKWFEKEGRDYPWRRTQDPYEVLVSEIMLQQTQITTVIERGYYTRFLKSFPTVIDLAQAADETLLKAWEGLGYYRRARMLRETAIAVMDRYQGKFPEDLNALLELPGIGRYTAGALRAFAFRRPSVLVDGNVSRVLARLFAFKQEVDRGPGIKQIWTWAEDLADKHRPMAYHSALMELGQRICQPKKTHCESCPVAAFCRCRKPEELPHKKVKTKVTEIQEHAIWQKNTKGSLLLHRESGNRRTGLWKLPLRSIEELKSLPVVAKYTYGITRYRVRLSVHAANKLKAQEGDEWVEIERIKDLPMAAPFRKVTERLLDEQSDS